MASISLGSPFNDRLPSASGILTGSTPITSGSTSLNRITNTISMVHGDLTGLDANDHPQYIYTAENGITLTGNEFKLGGQLAEDTIIYGGSKNLTFGSSLLNPINIFKIFATVGDLDFSTSLDFTVADKNIQIDTSGFVIKDNDSIGLQYDNNYYTNGSALDRWIPDWAAVKAYADSATSYTFQSGLYDRGAGVIQLGGTLVYDADIVGAGGLFSVSFTKLDDFDLSYYGDAVIKDENAIPKGLRYYTDYSATYTDRSLVDKAYVLSVITTGITWEEAVLDIVDMTTVEPVTPTVGDRYISSESGVGSETGTFTFTENYIYEWDGSPDWVETVPSSGDTLFVSGDTITPSNETGQFNYNGTSWVFLGGSYAHKDTTGLQGGNVTSEEYYHLTLAQHTNLTDGNVAKLDENETVTGQWTFNYSGYPVVIFENDTRLATATWHGFGDNDETVAFWGFGDYGMVFSREYYAADVPFIFRGKYDASNRNTCAELYPEGSVDLYYDGTQVFETTSDGIKIGTGDTGKLRAGPDGNDYIEIDGGAGDHIKHYINNSLVTKTVSTGLEITGTLTVSSSILQGTNDSHYFGSSRILNDTTDFYIQHRVHGGRLILTGEENGTGDQKTLFLADPDGAATLYHNGNPIISTESTGISVTGDVVASDDVAAADTFRTTGNTVIIGPQAGADTSGTIYLKPRGYEDDTSDSYLTSTTFQIGTDVNLSAGDLSIPTGIVTFKQGAVSGFSATFTGNTTDGFYHGPVANTWHLAANDASVVQIDTSGTTTTGDIIATGDVIAYG